jgi:hypothetical protein
MICSQTGTNKDGTRGLTDASFEIDKRDYLAHLASVTILNQTDLKPRDEQKIWSEVKWSG